MQPLLKRVEKLQESIAEAWQRLLLDAKREELARIDEQLADSNVWANPERAQILAKQSAALRDQIDPR